MVYKFKACYDQNKTYLRFVAVSFFCWANNSNGMSDPFREGKCYKHASTFSRKLSTFVDTQQFFWPFLPTSALPTNWYYFPHFFLNKSIVYEKIVIYCIFWNMKSVILWTFFNPENLLAVVYQHSVSYPLRMMGFVSNFCKGSNSQKMSKKMWKLVKEEWVLKTVL